MPYVRSAMVVVAVAFASPSRPTPTRGRDAGAGCLGCLPVHGARADRERAEGAGHRGVDDNAALGGRRERARRHVGRDGEGSRRACDLVRVRRAVVVRFGRIERASGPVLVRRIGSFHCGDRGRRHATDRPARPHARHPGRRRPGWRSASARLAVRPHDVDDASAEEFARARRAARGRFRVQPLDRSSQLASGRNQRAVASDPPAAVTPSDLFVLGASSSIVGIGHLTRSKLPPPDLFRRPRARCHRL